MQTMFFYESWSRDKVKRFMMTLNYIYVSKTIWVKDSRNDYVQPSTWFYLMHSIDIYMIFEKAGLVLEALILHDFRK